MLVIFYISGVYIFDRGQLLSNTSDSWKSCSQFLPVWSKSLSEPFHIYICKEFRRIRHGALLCLCYGFIYLFPHFLLDILQLFLSGYIMT
nr:hypothetical protein Iba_chr07aCG12670 [Ipomoea batatas]